LTRITTTTTTTEPSSCTYETWYPAIWKLETARHFRGLYLVPSLDRPWENKLPMAVFRGAATGFQSTKLEASWTAETTSYERCRHIPRCNLCYLYANSKTVDAKLTRLLNRGLTEVTNGRRIAQDYTHVRGVKSMDSLLKYKALIMLEGNDVSSGLKWVLLSNSVVMMPPPTFTSWAMEELLQPYIHYIPLYPNLTNVEEQVEWMKHHDKEAKEIAHRATLWMMDLVFHPNAREDDEWLQRAILEKYQQHV
jgi:hypothetical protein